MVREAGFWRGGFRAMACPCEALVEIDDELVARELIALVHDEARRIEHKFSRYLEGNIVHRINSAQGEAVKVDDETARLLDFADQLFELSEGRFDITSGALRRVWTFDGSDRVPERDAIDDVLQHVGWRKVSWDGSTIQLPVGMEIDLGGIGKEYAVDSCANRVREDSDVSVLINFGGDLVTTAPREDEAPWSVGRLVTGRDEAVALFELRRGAIATSGDAHRYLVRDGVRYSHVLDPRTGCPVPGAPHTVSVAAPTCIEAGMFSTLAMLHGEAAAEFLDAQRLDYWLD